MRYPLKQSGPTFVTEDNEGGDSDKFPHELRTQFWPLCCCATILSGMSSVAWQLTETELVDKIKSTLNNYLPDFQIEGGTQECSSVVWLVLNKDQTDSKKIMSVVNKLGFKPVARNDSMGGGITYFVRDTGGTFKLLNDV